MDEKINALYIMLYSTAILSYKLPLKRTLLINKNVWIFRNKNFC